MDDFLSFLRYQRPAFYLPQISVCMWHINDQRSPKNMWPYSARKSRTSTPELIPADLPSFDDYKHDDAEIRVWLSQRLLDGINWLSPTLDVSRPDVFKALIFEHLHGRIAYEAFIVHVQKLHRAKDQEDARLRSLREKVSDPWTAANLRDAHEIKQSPRRETPQDLKFIGKASENFKLALPHKMKLELAEVAAKHRLTTSHYVRKMLVQQLLGERLHSDWQKAIGQLPHNIEEIEQGA